MLEMLPRFGRRLAFLFITASALSIANAGGACAMEWSVDPQRSQIAFDANAGATKGVIKNYKAEIEFDPETPEQTSVHVTLDMRSVSTGSASADERLQSVDFFDPVRYPTAEFAGRGAKPDGEGKYILEGRLILKGVAEPLTLPFTVDISEGTALVKGEATINRLNFGVGPQSGDADVKLTIDLTAVRLDN